MSKSKNKGNQNGPNRAPSVPSARVQALWSDFIQFYHIIGRDETWSALSLAEQKETVRKVFDYATIICNDPAKDPRGLRSMGYVACRAAKIEGLEEVTKQAIERVYAETANATADDAGKLMILGSIALMDTDKTRADEAIARILKASEGLPKRHDEGCFTSRVLVDCLSDIAQSFRDEAQSITAAALLMNVTINRVFHREQLSADMERFKLGVFPTAPEVDMIVKAAQSALDTYRHYGSLEGVSAVEATKKMTVDLMDHYLKDVITAAVDAYPVSRLKLAFVEKANEAELLRPPLREASLAVKALEA